MVMLVVVVIMDLVIIILLKGMKIMLMLMMNHIHHKPGPSRRNAAAAADAVNYVPATNNDDNNVISGDENRTRISNMVTKGLLKNLEQAPLYLKLLVKLGQITTSTNKVLYMFLFSDETGYIDVICWDSKQGGQLFHRLVIGKTYQLKQGYLAPAIKTYSMTDHEFYINVKWAGHILETHRTIGNVLNHIPFHFVNLKEIIEGNVTIGQRVDLIGIVSRIHPQTGKTETKKSISKTIELKDSLISPVNQIDVELWDEQRKLITKKDVIVAILNAKIGTEFKGQHSVSVGQSSCIFKIDDDSIAESILSLTDKETFYNTLKKEKKSPRKRKSTDAGQGEGSPASIRRISQQPAKYTIPFIHALMSPSKKAQIFEEIIKNVTFSDDGVLGVHKYLGCSICTKSVDQGNIQESFKCNSNKCKGKSTLVNLLRINNLGLVDDAGNTLKGILWFGTSALFFHGNADMDRNDINIKRVGHTYDVSLKGKKDGSDWKISITKVVLSSPSTSTSSSHNISIPTLRDGPGIRVEPNNEVKQEEIEVVPHPTSNEGRRPITESRNGANTPGHVPAPDPSSSSSSNHNNILGNGIEHNLISADAQPIGVSSANHDEAVVTRAAQVEELNVTTTSSVSMEENVLTTETETINEESTTNQNQILQSHNIISTTTTALVSSSSIVNVMTHQNRLDFIDCTTPLVVNVKPAWEFMDKDENCYSMQSNPRGYAIMINITNNRDGSIYDTEYVTKFLKDVGYNITSDHSTTSTELSASIERFKDMLKSQPFVKSLIIVVMGHGQHHLIRMTDDVEVNVWTDIIYKFSQTACPALRGVPKIFAFQYCQTFPEGENIITNYMMNNPTSSSSYLNYKHPGPDMKDTLIIFPTLPGFEVARDIYKGSPFIYTMIKVFMEHSCNTDIIEMLKMVRTQLANNIQMPDPNYSQIPIWIDLLEKKFYFNPGLGIGY